MCVRSRTWVTVLFACATLAGCDPCAYEKFEHNMSPSGKLDAVTYRRGCRATVAYSDDLSIIRLGDTASVRRNLVWSGQGRRPVRWVSDTVLEIEYLGPPRLPLERGSIHGVRVNVIDLPVPHTPGT
jgi:hypothetical protein